MGRPALGKAARTRTGSTKISGFEKELLEEEFGTVASGMRRALDYYLAHGLQKASTKQRPGGVAMQTEVKQDLPTTVIPCRIHRGYVETNRWMDKGQVFVERTCVDCGHVTSGPAR